MTKKLLHISVLWGFLFISLMIFEFLLKLNILVVNGETKILYVTTFSLSYSLVILFIYLFFKPKTIQKLLLATIIILTFIFIASDLYYTTVANFFSVQVVGDFAMGFTFLGHVLKNLRPFHILYLIPLGGYFLLKRYYSEIFTDESLLPKMPLIVLLLAAFTFSLTVESIDDSTSVTFDDYIYSDKDLYDLAYNSQMTVKEYGLITYIQRDIINAIRPDSLREFEYIALIHNFLENQEVHYSNNYTNRLNDKNFILIMAESFDTFAINETLTPTLYALSQDGAYFENYYSPLYYRSTADTEFLTQTSFLPNKNVTLSMDAYIDNTFPYTLAKMFGEQGYNTYSYHNYTDYYYPRREFHTETLGYDVYKNAVDLGLLTQADEDGILFEHDWQRDTDLINLTVDDYINDDQFFVNYVTVSGHFTYTNTHEVAQYHLDIVDQYIEDNDLDIPNTIRVYLATAIELDLAVKSLMDQLEDAHRLDETVIMIYGDHYAYGVSENDIWAYDTVKDDENRLDIHNVPMMLYTPQGQITGVKTNYFSSIDILPTVANLFGLNMDYQQVFGSDIFSNTDNIVHFADLSFVSKNFTYDALTENFTISNDQYTKADLDYISNQFITTYHYDVLILDHDFYKPEDNED